jgi:hypothetical protein
MGNRIITPSCIPSHHVIGHTQKSRLSTSNVSVTWIPLPTIVDATGQAGTFSVGVDTLLQTVKSKEENFPLFVGQR